MENDQISKFSFQEKLINIQNQIKVLKENRNDFGRYNYRSCEDILHVAKPIVNKFYLTLTLSDRVELIGDRYYVVATACISDGKESFSNQAYAREGDKQAGMSEAQITGSSSSYARKYALSGLLGLDDEKDPDTQPPQKPQENKSINNTQSKPMGATNNPASPAQLNALKRMNIPFNDGISKSEASALIEQANKGR